MNKKITRHILTGLFAVLYCCVGFVSVYHSIEFFSLANALWLGIILASAFEIGQAAVLFSLLTIPEKKVMPWILMSVLTFVQILGNVYASFKYMLINSASDLHYFTDSILFFVKNPNPAYNNVMISYITGAILPLVALCMTGMVVNMMNKEDTPKKEGLPVSTGSVQRPVETPEPSQKPEVSESKQESDLKQVLKMIGDKPEPKVEKKEEKKPEPKPEKKEEKKPEAKQESEKSIEELHPNTMV